MALNVLRDYGKEDGDRDSADGAASSIRGLLEVAESAFPQGFAETIAEEMSAAAAYESLPRRRVARRTWRRRCKSWRHTSRRGSRSRGHLHGPGPT